MKIVNLLFILLFTVSAALQYNDPDSYLWVPLYVFGAFICWQALRGKYVSYLYIAGFVVYGAYAAYLLFGANGVISWATEHEAENIAQSMKATKPWIEETREFFGLLLLLLALGLNKVWLARSSKTYAAPAATAVTPPESS